MADVESDKEFSTASLAAIFQSMKLKTPILKYGRVGKPHFRYFSLNDNKTKLQWISNRKSQDQTEVLISSMDRLEEGQSSDVFLKNKSSSGDSGSTVDLSFSIYYYASGSAEKTMKTLDVVCKDKEEYTIWVQGLKWLIAHKGESLELSPEMTPSRTSDTTTSRAAEQTLETSVRGNTSISDAIDVYTCGIGLWGELGLCGDVTEIVNADEAKRVQYFVDTNVSDLRALSCGENHMAAITRFVFYCFKYNQHIKYRNLYLFFYQLR